MSGEYHTSAYDCQYVQVLDSGGAAQNNTLMTQPTFESVLNALCEKAPFVPKWQDGRVHHTRAAEKMGINQATLSRMLAGKSAHPTPENAKKLCEFFGVTHDQLVGNMEIDGLFEEDSYTYSKKWTTPPITHEKNEKALDALFFGGSKSETLRDVLTQHGPEVFAERIIAIAGDLPPKDYLKIARYLIAQAEDAI